MGIEMCSKGQNDAMHLVCIVIRLLVCLQRFEECIHLNVYVFTNIKKFFFCFFLSWLWYIDLWSELHTSHRKFSWIFYFFLPEPLFPCIIGWYRMSYQKYINFFHRNKENSPLSLSWQRKTPILFISLVCLYFILLQQPSQISAYKEVW